MGQIIMVLGGVRSGKSSFAEKLASGLSRQRVTYLATAEASDDEMSERIRRHQQSRPSSWKTVEARRNPGQLLESLTAESDVVLLDCLTIWISNILLDADESVEFSEIESRMREEIDAFITMMRTCDLTAIIVAGEVGMGVVPESKLGRQFRDLHGWANQALVASAAHSYFLVAGRPVHLNSVALSMEECLQDCQRS